MIEKINLREKLDRIRQPWKPRLAGQVNDCAIKLAKIQGEFIWHHHEAEDELFLVVSGQLTIRLRNGQVDLGPGEFVIIPRGVEHMPVSEDGAEVLLVEPASTLNTGNVRNDRTVADPEEI